MRSTSHFIHFKILSLLIFGLSNTSCSNLSKNNHQELELIWSSEQKNWNASSVLLYNESLYAHSVSDSIFKVDFATGTLNWKIPNSVSYMFSPPVAVNNQIFFSGRGYFQSIYSNGELAFTVNTNGQKSTGFQIINDSILLTTRRSNGLYAYSTTTGSEYWKILPPDQMLSTSKPIVIDSLVLVGDLGSIVNNDVGLYCYNWQNQKLRWRFLSNGYLNSPITAHLDNIYFSHDDSYKSGFTFKLNTITGEVIWKVSSYPSTSQSAILIDGLLFVPSYKSGVTCLNESNGKVMWLLTDDLTPSTQLHSFNNRIYFGTNDRRIISLDLKGKIQLDIKMKNSIGHFMIVKNALYMIDWGGNLYKITDV